MDPVLIGYFPKKTVRRPEWVKADHVSEICSVSEHNSEGPPDWDDEWIHNKHWVFNSPEDALLVIVQDAEEYDMYAYRLYPVRVDKTEIFDEEVIEPSVKPLSDEFELLGYDAVSRSCGSSFECSPLSCNNGAETFRCNSKCLFYTFEEALAGAREFSSGEWEPGPYYVVEVFRKPRLT